MAKRIIGIDPGIRGGMALLNGEIREVVKMPVYLIQKEIKKGKRKGKTRSVAKLDEDRIVHQFLEWSPNVIVIERQSVFPGQGGISNFTTGYGYGFLRGVAKSGLAQLVEVDPCAWQKRLFGAAKGNTKAKSYKLACDLFPDLADVFIGDKGGMLDGLTDAILIAEYGRRILHEH